MEQKWSVLNCKSNRSLDKSFNNLPYLLIVGNRKGNEIATNSQKILANIN